MKNTIRTALRETNLINKVSLVDFVLGLEVFWRMNPGHSMMIMMIMVINHHKYQH